MRTSILSVLPLLAVLGAAGCDAISQTTCCDTSSGPLRVRSSRCADPLPASACEDDEIRDPRIADCQRFCNLANQACDAEDECFAVCVVENVGPTQEAVDCVERATSCAGVQACWALFTGAPP